MKIPQNALCVTASFLKLIGIKDMQQQIPQVFLCKKSTGLFLSASDQSSCQCLEKIIEFNHSSCFTSDHKQLKQFVVLGLCLNSLNFCSLGRWYLNQ